MMFPESCERCHCSLTKGKITAHTMSFFNMQIICLDCKEKEKAHPRYKEAVDAEIAACKRGDFNFPGIGCPPELLSQS